MSDEMFPTQFIEGINEGETIDDRQFMEIAPYSFIAIKYTPTLTYHLSEFEIFTSITASEGIKVCNIKICPDYKGKPNQYDIILAEGIMQIEPVATSPLYRSWSKIILKNTITVSSNTNYWIVMTSNGKKVRLIRGIEGIQIPIFDQNKFDRSWAKNELYPNGWEIMARFYGRIVPAYR